MIRFTIRELVLLTVVVAMGLGWWLDNRNLVRHIAWLDKLAVYNTEVIAKFYDRILKDGHSVSFYPEGVTIRESDRRQTVSPLPCGNISDDN